MDDFYLPEEIVEWLGRKKSEFLSELICNVESDDFRIEEYQAFEQFIPETLSSPELVFESTEDKILLKTFIKSFSGPQFFQQIVVGAMIPDQNGDEVFVPILTFVSRKQGLIKVFCKGSASIKPILN